MLVSNSGRHRETRKPSSTSDVPGRHATSAWRHFLTEGLSPFQEQLGSELKHPLPETSPHAHDGPSYVAMRCDSRRQWKGAMGRFGLRAVMSDPRCFLSAVRSEQNSISEGRGIINPSMPQYGPEAPPHLRLGPGWSRNWTAYPAFRTYSPSEPPRPQWHMSALQVSLDRAKAAWDRHNPRLFHPTSLRQRTHRKARRHQPPARRATHRKARRSPEAWP